MKEINPTTSYAIGATYGKGKYGKGRGTLIQTGGGGMNKIQYLDWNQSQDNRIHLDTGLSPALGSSSGSSKPIIQVNTASIDNETSDASFITQKKRGFNKGGNKEVCPTITKNSFEHNNHVGNIRRLTEIECERLQGFKDNHTQYGVYEKQVWINKKEKTFEIVEHKHKVPRTQRYKLCGNAVTVDVVALIGNKLLKTIS